MKRNVVAVLIGGLFALPAFAFDGELDARLSAEALVTSTEFQNVISRGTDGEIGGQVTSTQVAAPKSRAEVSAEIDGQRAVDGETGQPLPYA